MGSPNALNIGTGLGGMAGGNLPDSEGRPLSKFDLERMASCPRCPEFSVGCQTRLKQRGYGEVSRN